MGLTLFALGLFKKVIFADGMAVYASAAFLAAENGVILTIYEAWLGSLAYTMQLTLIFQATRIWRLAWRLCLDLDFQ